MSIADRTTLLFLSGCCLLFACLTGCSPNPDQRTQTITLWHQMTVNERKALDEQVLRFEKDHPDIKVRTLYKETEELRSGFQAATLAGTGPELIYGPSDSMGTFVAMGIVQDLKPYFDQHELDEFVETGLTWVANSSDEKQNVLAQVGDRFGNHLALIYNRKLLPEPPTTTDELVAMAKKATLTRSGENKPYQYGLVWNFVEPFFAIPFLTGHGAWVFDDSGKPVPSLDTPECIAGLKFIESLQNEHRVLPINCDYETADTLFKSGAAAMIINGDWSWGDYLDNKSIDAAVAPLPLVSSTGKPMAPMVAPKGYSLNVHASGEQVQAAIKFVKFMTSVETQRNFLVQLKTIPSKKSLLTDPALTDDPTLVASARQMQNGRSMPIAPEMRAIWDSMRKSYQSLMGGKMSAEDAARKMQEDSVSAIEQMNRQNEPTSAGLILKLVAMTMTLGLLFWQRNAWFQFLENWKENRLAYALIAPSLVVIILTIVYPFLYNVVLSFSNMSLRNFQDWQVVGWEHYGEVFKKGGRFLPVLGKTIVWTVVCVFFHVAIGLMLAVALNSPIKGKSIYRILLILPWAIPAYITALTWRGMFDSEYGAINLIGTQFLGLPNINWLNDEVNTFIACIITNIWLGFPFMMVIVLGGMQGIPSEMYEAAMIDRVPRWKQFWHITLPMLKPVLIPAITLGTIWTFNNLNVVWLVSNSGEPSDKTHILVSYVYKEVFNLYRYGYGAALSMVIFGLLLIFALVFLKKSRATEAVG